jgi:hypothetical protein
MVSDTTVDELPRASLLSCQLRGGAPSLDLARKPPADDGDTLATVKSSDVSSDGGLSQRSRAAAPRRAPDDAVRTRYLRRLGIAAPRAAARGSSARAPGAAPSGGDGGLAPAPWRRIVLLRHARHGTTALKASVPAPARPPARAPAADGAHDLFSLPGGCPPPRLRQVSFDATVREASIPSRRSGSDRARSCTDRNNATWGVQDERARRRPAARPPRSAPLRRTEEDGADDARATYLDGVFDLEME